MSDASIPAPDDQHKPDMFSFQRFLCEERRHDEHRCRFLLGGHFQRERTGDSQPTPPAPPRRPKKERRSGLYLLLQAAQQHGITHPKDGYWVMLPREFDAILALEQKAVAQVVLEVLRQTIGRVGDGHDGRQEWATISYRHFARAGLMALSRAQLGIREALTKGYIQRRPVGSRRFEYSIRWKGTN